MRTWYIDRPLLAGLGVYAGWNGVATIVITAPGAYADPETEAREIDAALTELRSQIRAYQATR